MNLPPLKVGDLFAGVGGFSLAAELLGWQTAWFSEVDPYCCAVLKKRWPNTPNHGDIRTLEPRSKHVERVDVLCGGFPCQDISLAGKGAGIAGERSGLWSHYARVIEEGEPTFVVAENVSALRTRGLDRVLRDLWKIGYDAEWHCIPASAVGASHERDRIWVVAYPASIGMERLWPEGESFTPTLDRTLLSVRDSDGQWKVEPDFCRANDGTSGRSHRLKCCGNAIVPQVAYEIFSAIERARLKLSVKHLEDRAA